MVFNGWVFHDFPAGHAFLLPVPVAAWNPVLSGGLFRTLHQRHPRPSGECALIDTDTPDHDDAQQKEG